MDDWKIPLHDLGVPRYPLLFRKPPPYRHKKYQSDKDTIETTYYTPQIGRLEAQSDRVTKRWSGLVVWSGDIPSVSLGHALDHPKKNQLPSQLFSISASLFYSTSSCIQLPAVVEKIVKSLPGLYDFPPCALVYHNFPQENA